MDITWDDTVVNMNMYREQCHLVSDILVPKLGYDFCDSLKDVSGKDDEFGYKIVYFINQKLTSSAFSDILTLAKMGAQNWLPTSSLRAP